MGVDLGLVKVSVSFFKVKQIDGRVGHDGYLSPDFCTFQAGIVAKFHVRFELEECGNVCV